MSEDLQKIEALADFFAKIKSFQDAVRVYESEAASGQPSYSVIEYPKIQIANAVLRFMGISTEPNFDRVISLVDEPQKRDADKQRRVKIPIPTELRWAVFKRDGYKCVKCGSEVDLAADHVIPDSKGGPTTLENLQTLCRSCNSRKLDKMPEEVSA